MFSVNSSAVRLESSNPILLIATYLPYQNIDSCSSPVNLISTLKSILATVSEQRVPKAFDSKECTVNENLLRAWTHSGRFLVLAELMMSPDTAVLRAATGLLSFHQAVEGRCTMITASPIRAKLAHNV